MNRLITSLAVLSALVCAGNAAQGKSLYERLGGVHAIAAVCDDFVDRLLANKAIVSPLSRHVKLIPERVKQRTPGLKYLIVEQLCEAAGGPQRYSGKPMLAAHEFMQIDDAQWDAMVVDLKASLVKFKVPDPESREVLAAIGATKPDIVTGDRRQMLEMPRMPVIGPNAKLYDRLGGVYGIAHLVDDFVDHLLKDPTVGANASVVAALGHTTPAGIKFLLTSQLCAASGGPQKYVGRDMKDSHKGLGITEKEWDAAARVLVASMKRLKIGDREQGEILGIVESTKKDIVGG